MACAVTKNREPRNPVLKAILDTNLYDERGSNLSRVPNDFNETPTPKVPFDGVVEGKRKARFFLPRLFSPFLLPFIPIASHSPPDSTPNRRLNFPL